jgi:hypothetical protein
LRSVARTIISQRARVASSRHSHRRRRARAVATSQAANGVVVERARQGRWLARSRQEHPREHRHEMRAVRRQRPGAARPASRPAARGAPTDLST